MRGSNSRGSCPTWGGGQDASLPRASPGCVLGLGEHEQPGNFQALCCASVSSCVAMPEDLTLNRQRVPQAITQPPAVSREPLTARNTLLKFKGASSRPQESKGPPQATLEHRQGQRVREGRRCGGQASGWPWRGWAVSPQEGGKSKLVMLYYFFLWQCSERLQMSAC